MADPDSRLTWVTQGTYTKSPLEFNFEEQLKELRDLDSGDFTFVAALFDEKDVQMYSLAQNVHLITATPSSEKTSETEEEEEEVHTPLGEGAVADFVSYRRKVFVASPVASADECFAATVKVVSSRLRSYRLDIFLISGAEINLQVTPFSSFSLDLNSEMRPSENTVFERDIIFNKVRFASEQVGQQFTCYLRLYDKDEKRYHNVPESFVTFTVVRPEISSKLRLTLASQLPREIEVSYEHLPSGVDAMLTFVSDHIVSLPFVVLDGTPTDYVLHLDIYSPEERIDSEDCHFPFIYDVTPSLFGSDRQFVDLFCWLSRVDGKPMDVIVKVTYRLFWGRGHSEEVIEEVDSMEPVHLTIISPVDASRFTLGDKQVVSGSLPLFDCDLAVDPQQVPSSSSVLWYLVKEKKVLNLIQIQRLLDKKKCYPLVDRHGRALEGILITGWDCDYRKVFGTSLFGVPTTFTLLCVAYSDIESQRGKIPGKRLRRWLLKYKAFEVCVYFRRAVDCRQFF